MADSAENGLWPEPPAHVYPHRYAYCHSCGIVVRDFQRDAVWRDREGYMTCDHQPPAPGSTFHAPRVIPPGSERTDA